MARQEVLIDDLTKTAIADSRAVQLVVKYPDAKKGQHILDVSLDTELKGTVEELAKKGRHQGAAGRRAAKKSA